MTANQNQAIRTELEKNSRPYSAWTKSSGATPKLTVAATAIGIDFAK